MGTQEILLRIAMGLDGFALGFAVCALIWVLIDRKYRK